MKTHNSGEYSVLVASLPKYPEHVLCFDREASTDVASVRYVNTSIYFSRVNQGSPFYTIELRDSGEYAKKNHATLYEASNYAFLKILYNLKIESLLSGSKRDINNATATMREFLDISSRCQDVGIISTIEAFGKMLESQSSYVRAAGGYRSVFHDASDAAMLIDTNASFDVGDISCAPTGADFLKLLARSKRNVIISGGSNHFVSNRSRMVSLYLDSAVNAAFSGEPIEVIDDYAHLLYMSVLRRMLKDGFSFADKLVDSGLSAPIISAFVKIFGDKSDGKTNHGLMGNDVDLSSKDISVLFDIAWSANIAIKRSDALHVKKIRNFIDKLALGDDFILSPEAALNAGVDSLQKYFENGLNISNTPSACIVACIDAFGGSPADRLKLFLENGADPSSRFIGISPLLLASMAKNVYYVEALVDAGARCDDMIVSHHDIDEFRFNFHGEYRGLFSAYDYNKLSILVDNDEYEDNFREGHPNWGSLIFSEIMEGKNPDHCKRLIDAYARSGMNGNWLDRNGNTLLHAFLMCDSLHDCGDDDIKMIFDSLFRCGTDFSALSGSGANIFDAIGGDYAYYDFSVDHASRCASVFYEMCVMRRSEHTHQASSRRERDVDNSVGL